MHYQTRAEKTHENTQEIGTLSKRVPCLAHHAMRGGAQNIRMSGSETVPLPRTHGFKIIRFPLQRSRFVMGGILANR